MSTENTNIETNANGLTQEEQENVGINNLETLITAGTDAEVPIVIEYLGKEYGVTIRPLNSVELNTIQNAWVKTKESPDLNIVAKGLVEPQIRKNDLAKLPAGVISAISKEISVISGTVQTEQSQEDIINSIMGF